LRSDSSYLCKYHILASNINLKWIGVDNLKQLEVKWEEEKWQKNSMTNKQNRQSKVGHNVHSGGSISARVHRKKMVSDSFCLNYNVNMFILICCLLVMF
jgi:hypothetical protein